MSDATAKLRVIRTEAGADDVLTITLARDDGQDLPDWQPGSHVDLILPAGIERQYSLCGPIDNPREWQISVLHTLESRGGSDWIHANVRAQETLTVRGPRNKFPLVEAQHYLFIAGGIGITPILPMIKSLIARGHEDWRLVFGGRSRTSMAHLAELEPYADHVTVWPEDEKGRLDLETILGSPRIGTAVYCCGPEGLIKAVERQCRSWPPGTLHVERFRPAPDTGDNVDTAFEVTAAVSGVSVIVEVGQTIVEALEGYGVSIPTSCGEGVCGTCETRVLSGVPDHRDSVLSPEERASGTTIIPCRSRALSPALELDV
ncbi:PDR/VanB family oxidoreductase [soil metagenome]